MREWNRRDFVKAPGLAAVFAAAVRAAEGATDTGAGTQLAGQLTEIAAVDDCVRLLAYSEKTDDRTATLLTTLQEVVRAGGMMPAGQDRIDGLLGSGDDRKVALALGRVLQDAVHKHVAAEGEAAIYQDAAVLREIYISQPWAKEAGLESANPKQVDAIFALFVPRVLTILHTFTPDKDDVQRWIPLNVRWYRQVNSLMHDYAQAYSSPDPTKAKKYLGDTDFYNSEDGVIKMARAIQFGTAVDRSGFRQAVEDASGQSRYARALADGLLGLERAKARST